MNFISRSCDAVTPDDLPQVLRSRRGRYVLVTFDDGYRDNFEQALPILQSHGVRATYFVTTSFLDAPRVSWWDEIAWMVRSSRLPRIPASTWVEAPIHWDEPHREQAIRLLLRRYKSLPGCKTGAYLEFLADATGSGRCPDSVADIWMTWEMVREMRRAGMQIGGHTVHHPVLSQLSDQDQRQEIQYCKARIEQELNGPITAFSYPIGGRASFNGVTRACLADAGFRYAFSYYGGYRRMTDWDTYDIPRTAVETETSFAEFRAVLSAPQIFA